MKTARLVLALAFLAALLGLNQQVNAQTATAVAACGSASYTAGQQYPLQQTTTGNACSNASLSGSVTIGTIGAGTNIIGQVGIDQTTPGSTNGVVIAPSAAAGVGITSVVSSSAESGHIIKASAGNLYGIYATNFTNTSGWLVVVNSATVPGDGAVVPLACAALPPNGSANISRAPGPPQVYSTGISAFVSSAANCFTKTTGVITAFISGDAK